jgi:tetratricopeptide (TPR) repeat protein
LNRLPEALLVFEELFGSDPEFFEAIVAINKMLGKDSDNLGVYEIAAQRLEGRIRAARESDANSWSVGVHQYMICMFGKGTFARAKELLETEERLNEKDAVRLAFLKERHAENYLKWAQSLARQQPGTDLNIPEMVPMLEKSLELRPRYEQALQQLTHIAVDYPQFREQVLRIYDPFKDSNAPSSVLQVLANAEMIKRNYSQAVSLFEEARRKSPKDPHTLNNLAYSYLMSNSDNAERSLFLVEEALATLPRVSENIATQAAFLHTRGSALLQLNRLIEAAATFEMALQIRPDDVAILESLVKCYATQDPSQSEAYQKHLDSVREKTKPPSDETPAKETTEEKNNSNNSSKQPAP